MKLIKAGFDVKSWRYQITCDYCKSELEVEASDLQYAGDAGDWHDAGWESYTCYCSECNNNLTIPLAKVPALVKVTAQKRKKK